MSRRKWILPGCGLLLALGIIALIVATPAALALRFAGFRAEGKTDEIFDNKSPAQQPAILWSDEAALETSSTDLAVIPTPLATPAADGSVPDPVPATQAQVATGPVALEAVTVDIYFLSQPRTFYADEIFAKRLEKDTQNDQTVYYVEFDEEGANQYLNYWFGQYVDYQYMDRVKNPWVDLKPGGAIIYADVNLELGWKRVGAVFTLETTGRQLSLAGVDLDGKLYSTPPDGQIAQLVGQLESEANRALSDLTFLDPTGQLKLQVISLDENSVKLLAY